MAKHYEQLKKMKEKAERLQERAGLVDNPRRAEKYLRRAEIIRTSIQAIKDNWKTFGERARGNKNFKGRQHTQQARQKMSEARQEFWNTKVGFNKMWRARRRRQYREQGKCLIRFPRISCSVDKRWLKAYRKRYKQIVGNLPEFRCY